MYVVNIVWLRGLIACRCWPAPSAPPLPFSYTQKPRAHLIPKCDRPRAHRGRKHKLFSGNIILKVRSQLIVIPKADRPQELRPNEERPEAFIWNIQ